MKLKVILKGLVAGIVTMFLLSIIGFGILLEKHNFRASVSGQVTDGKGGAVPNAKLNFYMPNSDDIQYDCETITNSEGRYSVRLPSFRVALDTSLCYIRNVKIVAEGYEPSSKSVTLKKGSNLETNFVLQKEITVRGGELNVNGK
ncbi:MAG: carboxypeptidase-like regulatory domain-containing protein [Sedimentisphaeraceae bacterium JB056]